MSPLLMVPENPTPRRHVDGRVQVVLTYIDRNLHSELRLESIAKLVNVSPSRLRHIFKAEVGVCFASHVKTKRLRKAKELLETTFLSVKEIMSSIGVYDESHFVRDFKSMYGLPPMKYRAARQSAAKSANR